LTEKIYRTGTITRRRCLVCDNQRHKQARAARRTS
jgi:phosphoribosyl-dephospho-CoA transferase